MKKETEITDPAPPPAPTTIELKAIAYDLAVRINTLNTQLKQVEQMIADADKNLIATTN